MEEKDLMHSAEGIGGNEKISLSDVLNSIDKGKFAAPTGQDDDSKP